MRILRTLFIVVFPAWAVMLFAAAIRRLIGTPAHLDGWGLAVASGMVVGYFAWLLLLRPTARTSVLLIEPLLVIAAGVGLSVVATIRGSGSWLIPILTVSLAVGWMLYAWWYSNLLRGRSPLHKGETLPDLRLVDVEGRERTSAELAQAPAVWLFHRGNWCPFCVAQIRELAEAWQAVADCGAEVYLISPQSGRKNQSLADRLQVPFTVLTDPNRRAAKRLGIEDRWGTPMGFQVMGHSSHTVLPTVVVTAAGGRVLYADHTANYRVRPEPRAYLKLLRNA